MGSGITRPLCHSHDWLTAAMNNHSPNLSGVGGGPAVSGLACGALATNSGDFALGGDLLRFLSYLSSVSDFWLWWFFSWICFPWRFGFVGIVRFAGFVCLLFDSSCIAPDHPCSNSNADCGKNAFAV